MLDHGAANQARVILDRRCLKVSDFEQIFNTHYRAVYRLALSAAANPNDAEDICQETFLAVHKSLTKFRGEAQLSTWIYRIGIRTASRWLARHRRTRTTSTPDTASIDDSMPLDLLRAMAQLTLNDRVIISLVAIEGHSHQEAADILAIPSGTVASRLHHARRRLQTLLDA